MALAITQETFDEAVKENVKEFGMSTEEATEDAVKQFESQGVDLTNIIKDLMVSTSGSTSTISNVVTELANLAKNDKGVEIEKCKEKLDALRNECDRGLEYRVYAGKQGAYQIIMDIMMKPKYQADIEVLKNCMKTLTALMTKQPDLLDDKGIQTMIKFLDKRSESELQKLVLKWIKECCIMHETNRQNIFEAAILDHLKLLLEHADSAMLRDVLAVLRALVLDDDVRVEFSRSHEHARVIASDTLCSITVLLSKFKTDEPLMNDLMLTLSALLVRNEFCKKLKDAGGLEMLKDVMINFHEKEKLIKQSFKLLKALAGNDEVKGDIIQKDFAPIITSTLNRHKNSAQTAACGLACVTALTLRSPNNSKEFFEAGIPDVIADCMKSHLEDINVQKNASWAIRNMVSRSRYQNEKFLSLGVEVILQQDLKKFTNCEYDFKSALRDLGCDVKLKEEWTGKGGKITTQEKSS